MGELEKPQRPETPAPQPMLRVGADDPRKETFNYNLAVIEAHWNRLVIYPIMDALRDFVVSLTMGIETFVNSFNEAEPVKNKKGEKRQVSGGDIARILYIRCPFDLATCKMLAPHILRLNAIDRLEFAICAPTMGYPSIVMRDMLLDGRYLECINLWRKTEPPKYWDYGRTAEFLNLEGVSLPNVLVRQDGEILVIEDAPPVEYWHDGYMDDDYSSVMKK